MRRSKSYSAKLGFTLVELLVVITIIGTLMSLLLPAVQQARETARGLTCKNNIGQLGKAMLLYENSYGRFPGFVERFQNPNDPNDRGKVGSWVVSIFPYIEENAADEAWTQRDGTMPDTDPRLFAPSIDFLNCASDPPDFADQPTLSYVVNTGRITGGNVPHADNPANGMFFRRDCGFSESPEDITCRNSRREMGLQYLDSHDGASKTMMLSENVHTLYYVYHDPESGQYVEPSANGVQKQHFGFVWHPNKPRQVNPLITQPQDEFVEEMENLKPDPHGFPSSRHPGHVNRCFADGHVSQMSDTIDQKVYRELMTTRGKRPPSDDPTAGTVLNLDL